MNRLITSEFLRLFKSGIFKLLMVFSAGLGIFVIFMRWSDVKMNPEIYSHLSVEYRNADGLLFVGSLYIIFAIAVFISIFAGTEYSDGTIRNKIIVGHTRHSIYISKLIVCTVGSISSHILYILTVLVFGNLFIGGTTISATKIIVLMAVSTASILAMTAFLLMLSMSIQNRAAGAVVCLLSTLIMLFSSMNIYFRLSQPEYYDSYEFTDEKTGETITIEEKKKNPRYLTGEQRKIYEFLNNFLPTSQLNQIMELNSDNINFYLLYDSIIIIATTGIAIVILKRKNLK